MATFGFSWGNQLLNKLLAGLGISPGSCDLGAAGLAAAAAVALAGNSVQAQTPTPATGPYSIKPLPFAPNLSGPE